MAFLTSCLLSYKRVAFHYGAQLGTEAEGTQVTRWDLPGISRGTPSTLLSGTSPGADGIRVG